MSKRKEQPTALPQDDATAERRPRVSLSPLDLDGATGGPPAGAFGDPAGARYVLGVQEAPKPLKPTKDTRIPQECLDDPFMEMRPWGPDVQWPWCTACGCWSDGSHIIGKQHQKSKRKMEEAASEGAVKKDSSEPDSGSSRPQSARGIPEILQEAAGALAHIQPAQVATASASASAHLPSPQKAAPSPATQPGQATVTPSKVENLDVAIWMSITKRHQAARPVFLVSTEEVARRRAAAPATGSASSRWLAPDSEVAPILSRSTSFASSCALVLLEHIESTMRNIRVFAVIMCKRDPTLEGLHVTTLPNIERQLPGGSVAASEAIVSDEFKSLRDAQSYWARFRSDGCPLFIYGD